MDMNFILLAAEVQEEVIENPIDWTLILLAVGVVAAIGLIAGLGLSIASKIFALTKRQRQSGNVFPVPTAAPADSQDATATPPPSQKAKQQTRRYAHPAETIPQKLSAR